MSCLKYYKLQSNFPCDQTGVCLTKEDIDSNFYELKLDDLSAATYNAESMTVSLVINSGEEISIDLSEIQTQYTEAIEAAMSGITSGTSSIEISGELDDNGVLTLTWTDQTGEHSTQISGFLCPCEGSAVYHNETLTGDGSKTYPLRLSETEKTGYYKNVKGIVDSLPEQPEEGDRYVTKETVSTFGRLYTREALEYIKTALEDSMSPWRIATPQDWQKLIQYADVECEEESRSVAGKVLKSRSYWEEGDNTDEYGFSIVPAGYVMRGALEGTGTDAVLWGYNDTIFVFTSTSDGVILERPEFDSMYSVRLVMDIGEQPVQNKVTILGNEYEVVAMPEIGLAWIKTNLAYKTPKFSQQYEYGYPGITREVYHIRDWDGNKWTSKPLEPGDKFSTVEDNTITDHMVMTSQNGQLGIITSFKYTWTEQGKKTHIDAGWY